MNKKQFVLFPLFIIIFSALVFLGFYVAINNQNVATAKEGKPFAKPCRKPITRPVPPMKVQIKKIIDTANENKKILEAKAKNIQQIKEELSQITKIVKQIQARDKKRRRPRKKRYYRMIRCKYNKETKIRRCKAYYKRIRPRR